MKGIHRIGWIVVALVVCVWAVVLRNMEERRRSEVQPGDLYEIVWQQIVAMREADYARAYQHASNGFQERFNVDTYTELVRSEYPALLRATRVEFGGVRFDPSRALVQANFFLPDGDVIPCLYILVYEDGTWRIDAISVKKRLRTEEAPRGLRV